MSVSSAQRDQEAAGLLALLDAPGVGPKRVLELLEKFGDSQSAIDAAISHSAVGDKAREHLLTSDPATYLGVIANTRALGGDYKLWNDVDYPGNLAKWSGRPPVLFFKGSLDRLTARSLALVGRVDPTEIGEDAARRFARLCVESDINVVSGLAKGIDAASHAGSLDDPPGRTYAVLGHGLDFAYPAENASLYNAIPSHGAVISQFGTGVGPQRWTFPARNEVMCTLALGTVIIEGKEGCGSIIQADFSFKHGRPVFILSRNLKTADTSWAEKLVKRGAHVIERFEQVTEIVERTMGDLWGEREVQGTFFDHADLRGLESLPEEQMTEPRAALFDLDGVVVDTQAVTRSALTEIAEAHLGRPVDPLAVRVADSPYKALQALGVSGAWDVYKAEYSPVWEKHLPETVVWDSVVQTITALVADGWYVGAITGQNKARARLMIPPHVWSMFEEIYTSSSDKAEGIRRALRTGGVGAGRAFYIGDTPKDVAAAQSAGVVSVAVLWGYSDESSLRAARPDYLLSTPEDASDLLGLFGGVARQVGV